MREKGIISDGNVVMTMTVPVGTILPYCGTSAPTGFLICNGGEISRESYSDLFQLIGTAYGAGNGSTTFNLPNMHHRFLEGTTTTSEVNTYVSAGLPNITGHNGFGGRQWKTYHINYTDGAFKEDTAFDKVNGYLDVWGSGTDLGANASYLDASRSSSIYNKSSTVQPESLRVIFIIKF